MTGPGERSKTALFFVDSFVFGEGVRDDETLSYYFGAAQRRYEPVNYSFRGYGLSHLLAKLESRTLAREVGPKEGLLLYGFMPNHLKRINCSMQEGSLHRRTPYYRLEGRELRRDGSCSTGRPFVSWIRRGLGRSAIVRLSRKDIPDSGDEETADLACAYLERTQELLGEQLPRFRLKVLFRPDADGDRIIEKCLKPRGIGYVDLRAAFDGRRTTPLEIPFDGHPTAFANRLLAETLARRVDD